MNGFSKSGLFQIMKQLTKASIKPQKASYPLSLSKLNTNTRSTFTSLAHHNSFKAKGENSLMNNSNSLSVAKKQHSLNASQVKHIKLRPNKIKLSKKSKRNESSLPDCYDFKGKSKAYSGGILKMSHSSLEISDIKPHFQPKHITRYSCFTRAGEQMGLIQRNQDAYLALLDYYVDDKKDRRNAMSLFGMFDGHGDHGHFVSHTVKEAIKDYFSRENNFNGKKDDESLSDFIRHNCYGIIHKAYDIAFKSLRMKAFDSDLSGTTCLLILVLTDTIICSNVGDSRAILYGSSTTDINPHGYCLFELSKDQKPTLKEDYQRIVNSSSLFTDKDKAVRFLSNSKFVPALCSEAGYFICASNKRNNVSLWIERQLHRDRPC